MGQTSVSIGLLLYEGIFREFLKLINVFGIKIFLGGGGGGVVVHLFAPSLKSNKWCLPDQGPNSPPKKFNLLLFTVFVVSSKTMTKNT